MDFTPSARPGQRPPAVPSKYPFTFGHTASATFRPSFSPSTLSAWMWYPPMTREMPAISAVAVNVGSFSATSHESPFWWNGLPSTACISSQANPGSVRSPALRSSTPPNRSLPVNSSSIFPHAPLTVLCPDTYPGNGGVTNVRGEYGYQSSAGTSATPLPGPTQPFTVLPLYRCRTRVHGRELS